MISRQFSAKMRQILATKFGTQFRDVTEIAEVTTPTPGPREVLVKNRFLGINASDINYTAGRYDPTLKLPFPAGFEAMGEVVSAGSETSMKPGQSVMYTKVGSFADFVAVREATAIPIPTCDPAFLTFMVSGLTASLALEKEGDLKPGQTVLVTAAAGGTGQFAVQLAKLAGCHVIGTCSSDDKADFLKSIGCDRVINYSKEKIEEVLHKEYPKGLNVVYESIGNEMFDAALKNLATFGRLIIIGMIANYEDKSGSSKSTFIAAGGVTKVPIAMTCLMKSASIRGFYLMHYESDIPRHIATLIQLYREGKLKVAMDKGEGAAKGPFVGLEKVADALEYMYLRKNMGKVVVELATNGDKSAL